MAIVNIHIFTRLLEDLEKHIKKLNFLLRQASKTARNAGEIHKTMYKTSCYNLLEDLENRIRDLNSLSQQVLIIANNAYGTNTAMYQTCQNWRRELNKT